ncbi:MAG TPA: hypothetical protein ENK57_12330 [Polyangiaceae bacterium]|nr:hypothetical protein [Polyangiaceae bacterium]
MHRPRKRVRGRQARVAGLGLGRRQWRAALVGLTLADGLIGAETFDAPLALGAQLQARDQLLGLVAQTLDQPELS